MSSKFGLLLCLLIAVHVASASLSKRSRMLTTDYVTKSGEVTINKDSYGYYVNADLSYNYYDASDSEADDSYIAQMSLGLYTSQTVFSTDCLEFNDYYCSEYNCYEYTSESKTPSYLDFKVTTGYYASTNLYLDYGNWELQSGAVIAAYCDDNTYSSYGYERYGILGLGFNGTSSNFINNSMFSISLARDGSSGTLLFWSNSDMTSYDNYVGELTSTLDWQIAPSYIYVYVNSNYVTSTYSGLIFDLNTNGIAFPSNIYTSIIEDLEDAVSGMSCNIYNYQPYCYYYGRVGDLPTISIDVQGVQINLPPTLYVLDESDSDSYVDGIYLNFRLISPSYSGYNYVSSAYQNYIILDSSFMRYYYAEFSYNSGSPFISLYSQPSTPNNPSSNPSWPYIVGGVVGAIVIFSIICCCIKRRQVKLQQENTRRLITPYEAPQVTNVVIAAPAPAQTYPQYDQGGYGYGYYQQYQQAPNQTNAYGTYDNGNAYNYQQGQYYGN